MLPKGCIVEGRNGLLTAEAVRAYRHYGLLLVKDFLPTAPLQQLTTLCNAAARRRGDALFPGIDPQHQHGATTGIKAELHTQARPGSAHVTAAATQSASPRVVTEMGFGSGPLSPEQVQQAAAADEQRSFDVHTQKIHLKFKNQRAVERAYRRLAKARDRYYAYKRIRQHVSEEEEYSGKMSNERIRDLAKSYTYDDLKRGFQQYRDSGQLENEIRHEHHVNEAMRFMQNWPRTWGWLAQSSPELQALALSISGDVGRRVGEAAGHLSGEVLLRVYSDSAVQDSPLTNGIPLSCAAIGANFAHPQALSVQLGLSAPDGVERESAALAQLVAMPGSHHVVRRISQDGKEMDRFLTGGAFDMGAVVRRIPELSHLPVVEVPPLVPGAALFLNHYLVVGLLPTLLGPAQASKTMVMTAPGVRVANYCLAIIPDRCVFDGQRNSWASRDSHGPLYSYKRGDLLTDDAKFPVIHRALDIE